MDDRNPINAERERHLKDPNIRHAADDEWD